MGVLLDDVFPSHIHACTLACHIVQGIECIGRIYAAVAVNVSRKQFLAGQRALVSGTDICRVLQQFENIRTVEFLAAVAVAPSAVWSRPTLPLY